MKEDYQSFGLYGKIEGPSAEFADRKIDFMASWKRLDEE